MYKRLKELLWARIDASLATRAGLKPAKKSAVWRIYRRKDDAVFVTVEYFAVAGGKFVFAAGRSDGVLPSQEDVPATTPGAVPPGGFALFAATAFGLPPARIDVELDWQTPSAALVGRVLAVQEAATILAPLGITATRNHQALSFDIVEAVGVAVGDADLEPVVDLFAAALDHVLDASVEPLLRAIAR